jgi:hypothetical protein
MVDAIGCHTDHDLMAPATKSLVFMLRNFVDALQYALIRSK